MSDLPWVDSEAAVRLTDGERTMGHPSFTGFEQLIVAITTQVFEEGFATGLDTEEVWNKTEVGTGVVTVVDSQGEFETLAIGDEAQIQTKLPHQFLHGFSTTWRISLHTPDTGDASAVREWGVFDDDNGYFFRLSSAGVLDCVIRRKTIDTVTNITNSYTAGRHPYAIQYLDGNKVTFYYNGTLVHQANSSSTNLIALSNLKSTVRNTQTATVGSRKLSIFGLAVIRDGAPLRFNTSGELIVTSGGITTPPGSIKVLRPTGDPLIELGPNDVQDDFYLITNGLALSIQQLSARVESAGTGKSVRIQLFYDPLGDNPVGPSDNVPASWERLDTLMGNNFNQDAPQTKTVTGDGTARVVLRLQQTGSASVAAVGFWQGFEA